MNKRTAIASVLNAQRKGATLTSRGKRIVALRETARMGRNLANLGKKGRLTARGERTLAKLREQGLAPK